MQMEGKMGTLNLFENEKFQKSDRIEEKENGDYRMVGEIKDIIEDKYLTPTYKINRITDLIFKE